MAELNVSLADALRSGKSVAELTKEFNEQLDKAKAQLEQEAKEKACAAEREKALDEIREYLIDDVCEYIYQLGVVKEPVSDEDREKLLKTLKSEEAFIKGAKVHKWKLEGNPLTWFFDFI